MPRGRSVRFIACAPPSMKSSITGSRTGRRSRRGRHCSSALRVRILRILEHALRGALLLDLAVAHHDDVVGDLAHHGEVVRDEEHRHLVLLLQRADQVEDLLLDRDVERRRGLVGDQELGLARDRHRDHHALLLAARHLRRVGVDLELGIGNADFVQQLDRALPRRRRAQAHVQPQHFDQLVTDGEHRVERGHRLLEDHRDLGAAQASAARRREARRCCGRRTGCCSPDRRSNSPAAEAPGSRARSPTCRCPIRRRARRSSSSGCRRRCP